MKNYKFLFLVLLFGLFFIPKDVFAIEINNNGLFCQYSIDGTQTCNQLERIEFPNGQVGYGGILRPINNRGINYVAMDFYNQSFCVNENSGGTWNGWIWFENKGDRDLVYASDKIRVHAGTDRFNCSFKKNGDYGIDFLCTLSRPINNETITFDIPYLDMVTPNYLPVAIGIGEWTQGTQKCVLDESSIIANDNKNTDKIIQNQNENHQEAETTRKGILSTLKNIPNIIIDGIKSLFIPDDMSFLENFRDSLVDKLGFIAEVPLAVLDFILNLLTASWEEFNSITLPSINIFGFSFWNETTISLQPAIDIFKPYLWVTDILCVVLCVNTLRKWYEGFAAGGGHQ